jgi:hypothetical protein
MECASEEGKELDHAHPGRRDVEFLGQEAGPQCKDVSDQAV